MHSHGDALHDDGVGAGGKDMGYGLEGGSMIRINENMLKNTAARVEKNHYGNPFVYPLAKPIISGETYTFSYEGEVGEGVTSIMLFNSGGEVWEYEKSIENVQVKNNRKFVTFVAVNQTRENIGLYIYFPPSTLNVLNWMEKAKLELGTEATLWTPAEADLTPEQIALMKYGEFEEIKTI